MFDRTSGSVEFANDQALGRSRYKEESARDHLLKWAGHTSYVGSWRPDPEGISPYHAIAKPALVMTDLPDPTLKGGGDGEINNEIL